MHLLFLCTGNACRSQMAEGWARHFAAELGAERKLSFSSAGLEAHGLNPLAVDSMSRHGINISHHTSTGISNDILAKADVLITVCDHADSHCPLLPTGKDKRHLPFPDPAQAAGSDAEIAIFFDDVCLQIKQEIRLLIAGIIQ